MRAFQQARPATQYVSQCHCERSEAISLFHPLRLPRRPSWLLAMTNTETIPSPVVISSEARNPYDVTPEASFYEVSTIPLRRKTPLNVIASEAKQSRSFSR